MIGFSLKKKIDYKSTQDPTMKKKGKSSSKRSKTILDIAIPKQEAMLIK